MSLCWQDQEARIDRLLRIVNAEDGFALAPGLEFQDIVLFACQNLWHLKDWIQSDPEFRAHDIVQLSRDIHTEPALLVCADIANRSKHHTLARSRTATSEVRWAGIHIDSGKGVDKRYYCITSEDPSSRFHGMEVREFFEECRRAWTRIISKHYLSAVGLDV